MSVSLSFSLGLVLAECWRLCNDADASQAAAAAPAASVQPESISPAPPTAAAALFLDAGVHLPARCGGPNNSNGGASADSTQAERQTRLTEDRHGKQPRVQFDTPLHNATKPHYKTETQGSSKQAESQKTHHWPAQLQRRVLGQTGQGVWSSAA